MAQEVVQELRSAHPERAIRHVVVSTSGDRDRSTSLRALGGEYQGVFIKELEHALSDGSIDVAVHSLKDLPSVLSAEFALAAVPRRADARDVLCGSTLAGLPSGARVGTGSPRRQAQLLHLRPDLRMVALRGNVPPRLNRLKGEHALDAVVLAAAGLERLGLVHETMELLPLDVFPPAAGQGAMGLEVRSDDAASKDCLSCVQCPGSAAAVEAERAVLRLLHGGCSVPIGVIGTIDRHELTLRAQVTSLDGRRAIKKVVVGAWTDPLAVARDLADQLMSGGAQEILGEARAVDSSVG
jgi:hydroxymethylbilane synthase